MCFVWLRESGIRFAVPPGSRADGSYGEMGQPVGLPEVDGPVPGRRPESKSDQRLAAEIGGAAALGTDILP
jgi:hypothetical protein